MSTPSEMDFYFREATVLDGQWVGFRFAWRGLGGYDQNGLPMAPHEHSWTWVRDPAFPDYIDHGGWINQIWRFYALVSVGLPNTWGAQPQPYTGGEVANDPELQLGWLRLFRDLALVEMKQPGTDASSYFVKVYGYEERLLESYDVAHQNKGSYMVILDLVEDTGPGLGD